MPKYGFFRYGTSVYGNLLRETSKSMLLAQAIDYGKVKVTIVAGPRVGSGYVLVRTKNGSAFDPAQGVTVASGVVAGQEFSVVDGVVNFADDFASNDVAVPSGMVFYTLFIINETGQWIRDAATSVFSPINKKTLEKFLQILPPVLTTASNDPLDVPETTTDIAKFLGGIAVTYDELQTELDAVMPATSRGSAVLRGLHESLARSSGMPVEFTIGVGSSSRLFRQAGFIYRDKGTLTGIRAFTEALTGWPTIAYDSPNMIRYLDDASFETGTGRWNATGATLTQQLVGGMYLKPSLPHDYFLSPFAGDGIALVTLDGTTATLELPELPAAGASTSFDTGRSLAARFVCIPVLSDTAYHFSAFLNPYMLTGAATATFAVEWLDQQGEVLSTTVGSTQSLAALSDWTRLSEQVQSAAGAAFAKLEIRFTGTAGDEIGLDSVQFSASDIHYHDPRTVTIVCSPSRVNLLTGANFDTELNWTANTGTAERSTTAPLFGTHCLGLTGPFDVVTEQVPARPGVLLNFSAYFRGDPADVKIEYLDSAGDVIDVNDPAAQVPNAYEGTVSTTSTADWQRFETTGLAPEGAENVRVRVSGDGDTFLDAALLERSEAARIYFDADTADDAGEDAVVANFDGHVYSLLYPSRLARLSRLRTTIPFYLAMGVSARILLWDSDDPVVTDNLPYGT